MYSMVHFYTGISTKNITFKINYLNYKSKEKYRRANLKDCVQGLGAVTIQVIINTWFVFECESLFLTLENSNLTLWLFQGFQAHVSLQTLSVVTDENCLFEMCLSLDFLDFFAQTF